MNRVWTIILDVGEDSDVYEPSGPAVRLNGRHRTGAKAARSRAAALERTLDLAEQLSPARQVITVIGDGLEPESPRAAISGHLLQGPDGLGSATAAFLGLSIVRNADAHASVVILPTEHLPSESLVRDVRSALVAGVVLSRVVLLGRAPQSTEEPHAWICPGIRLDDQGTGFAVERVTALVDPPPAFVARALERTGALWDTAVLAGPLDRLWTLGRAYLPDVMERLDPLVTDPEVRDSVDLATFAGTLPRRSLSFDLLRPAHDALGVIRVQPAAVRDHAVGA